MAAYYNENDMPTAAWLRELIREGLIADGEVDTRSIRDVAADDVRGFTQCHFFAGIGGWSFALRLAGWPDDSAVWTGSCPCQPFSVAGKRAGTADSRHLWPAWFELIDECGPPVVFGEQVASADGRTWLDLVYANLEARNYAVGTAVLPAAGVGAPHGRHRFYFVGSMGVGLAHSQADRCGQGRPDTSGRDEGIGAPRTGIGSPHDCAISGVGLANANGAGQRLVRREGLSTDRDPSRRHDADGCSEDGGVGLADTSGERRQQVTGGPSGDEGADGREPHADHVVAGHVEDRGERLALTRRESARRRVRRSGQGAGTDDIRPPDQSRRPSATCGDALGVPIGAGLEKRERNGRVQREAMDPFEGQAIERRGDIGFWSDLVWLPCRDGKYRPTQSGLFPLAHGVSGRVGLLRGAGNAICPEVAQVFIEAYLDTLKGLPDVD